MIVSRVTNSMLKNTLLSNLGMNLSRMDKLQNQLSTGRKYGNISDDPSALIYGQAARNKLARLSHYQSAVETAQTWLTQAEAGVMEVNKVIGAVYEELVSAGSVKTPDDKKNLAMVVGQLRDHYVDTLNTAFGDRFVFSGYNTPGDFAAGKDPVLKPFTIVNVPIPGGTEPRLHFNGFDISQFDGELASDFPDLIPGPEGEFLRQLLNDVIKFDVGPGIEMPVTQNGIDIVFFVTRDEDGNAIVRNTWNLLQEVYEAINGIDPDDPLTTDELTKKIKLVQDAQNHVLTRTAELGGRQRRLELLEARY